MTSKELITDGMKMDVVKVLLEETQNTVVKLEAELKALKTDEMLRIEKDLDDAKTMRSALAEMAMPEGGEVAVKGYTIARVLAPKYGITEDLLRNDPELARKLVSDYELDIGFSSEDLNSILRKEYTDPDVREVKKKLMMKTLSYRVVAKKA